MSRPDRVRREPGKRTSLGPTGRATVIAAVLAVPLVSLAVTAHPDGESGDTGDVAAAPQLSVPIASRARVVPTAGRPARPVAPPVGVVAPSIGLAAGLPEPLDVDAQGRLGAPVDYARIGWWTHGPKPGEAGPAVIVGHVDSFRGPAVFFRLRELKPGDTVVVPRSDGRQTRFTVDAVRHFPKGAFPSAEVYGPTANAQLRLITCGGPFDRAERSYEDNIVVFASVH